MRGMGVIDAPAQAADDDEGVTSAGSPRIVLDDRPVGSCCALSISSCNAVDKTGWPSQVSMEALTGNEEKAFQGSPQRLNPQRFHQTDVKNVSSPIVTDEPPPIHHQVESIAIDIMSDKPEASVPEPVQETVEEDLGCFGCCPGAPPRDEWALLTETNYWCWYCCCGGCGRSKNMGSLYYSTHCVCFDANCAATNWRAADVDGDGVADGIVYVLQQCCCCTQLLQVPQRQLNPYYICCGYVFGKMSPKDVGPHAPKHMQVKPQTGFDALGNPVADSWDQNLFGEFTLCFLKWGGCTCRPPSEDMDSLCSSQQKCAGVTCGCSTIVPMYLCEEEWPPEGLCLNWCAFRQSRGHCRVPPLTPKTGNPMCACCGRRYKKHPSSKTVPTSTKPPPAAEAAVPAQVTMKSA
eukprot:TRINITY_DN26301_c1_g4_i1.p1 TRINITY_DN26301_c1_g4~~TRINITY_DN26301_c1_g4_i1.p1  ORF type:complete len:406 (+),score=55.51 TRINITY_DN26301_c1_g4_i1:95-1312(+)